MLIEFTIFLLTHGVWHIYGVVQASQVIYRSSGLAQDRSNPSALAMGLL